MHTVTSVYLASLGQDGSLTDFLIVIGIVTVIFSAFSCAFKIRSI